MSLHNISYQNLHFSQDAKRSTWMYETMAAYLFNFLSYQLHLKIVFFCIFCSFTVLSCSTVNSRIRENRTQFEEISPEAQMQIQSGNIDKGFTEEMVYMAKGKPDDKTTIIRDGKTLVLWKYAHSSFKSINNAYPQGALNAPYGYPTFGPTPSTSAPMLYEHSFFIVEFLDGKVIGWSDE